MSHATTPLVAHAYAGVPGHDALPREHAVALAMSADAELVSVHASTPGGPDPVHPAEAGELLHRWGRDTSVVGERSVLHTCCDDPIDTVLDALRGLSPDLVVLGTEQRRGLPRIFAESRAEGIATHLATPTLIVPESARTFVGSNGELELSDIAIPCGDPAAARAAIQAAAWLLRFVGRDAATLRLLTVGGQRTPEVSLDLPEGIRVERRVLEGDVDRALAESAEDASLVVMATRGRDSLYDGLMGSHTERVLRLTHRPVLTVRVD